MKKMDPSDWSDLSDPTDHSAAWARETSGATREEALRRDTYTLLGMDLATEGCDAAHAEA